MMTEVGSDQEQAATCLKTSMKLTDEKHLSLKAIGTMTTWPTAAPLNYGLQLQVTSPSPQQQPSALLKVRYQLLGCLTVKQIYAFC